MQAAILAGGLGTRLRPLTDKVPKAMIMIKGRPFLEYELGLLKAKGVDDIVMCVGHLGKQIEDHFGNGSHYGVRIRYSSDGDHPLGPIGGLKGAEALLDKDFLVTYGDAYLSLDYRAIMGALYGGGVEGVMAAFRNEGRFGKSDLIVEDGFVTAYDKRVVRKGMVWINYGVVALKKRALRAVEAGRFCSEESFYGELIARRQLKAFETHQRFYEIGSAEGLRDFESAIEAGLVA